MRRKQDGLTGRGEIGRREFIKWAGVAGAGALVAGCTASPSYVRMVEMDTPSLETPTAIQESTEQFKAKVAISRPGNYNSKTVRQELQNMLDRLGGFGETIKPGAKVGIKVNLTGGTRAEPQGVKGIDTYITHPEVVWALCELLRDSGVKSLYLMDGLFDQPSFAHWGYDLISNAMDAKMIDLNKSDPYRGFTQAEVGAGWYFYKDFTFNPLLTELDALISVAKMKCHYNAGVTLSMKNLVGLAPMDYYLRPGTKGSRTGFHGEDGRADRRLPKVILDLNRARPVQFSLIDGIKTCEGGEGPWINTFGAVSPGVLIAGTNPVATDAVAAAVMGFDPAAEDFKPPFTRSLNYLALANLLGLGTHRLHEIEVLGNQIGEVSTRFRLSGE